MTVWFIIYVILIMLGIWKKLDKQKARRVSKLDNKIYLGKKQKREKAIEQIIENFRNEMLQFTRENNRLQKITYDIEEGGDYLTEYNKRDCFIINTIINEEIENQSKNYFSHAFYMEQHFNGIEMTTREKVQKRILEEINPYSENKKDLYLA